MSESNAYHSFHPLDDPTARLEFLFSRYAAGAAAPLAT
jgi:hypothetical protein